MTRLSGRSGDKREGKKGLVGCLTFPGWWEEGVGVQLTGPRAGLRLSRWGQTGFNLRAGRDSGEGPASGCLCTQTPVCGPPMQPTCSGHQPTCSWQGLQSPPIPSGRCTCRRCCRMLSPFLSTWRSAPPSCAACRPQTPRTLGS